MKSRSFQFNFNQWDFDNKLDVGFIGQGKRGLQKTWNSVCIWCVSEYVQVCVCTYICCVSVYVGAYTRVDVCVSGCKLAGDAYILLLAPHTHPVRLVILPLINS